MKKLMMITILLTMIFLSGCHLFDVKVTYFNVNFYAGDVLIKSETVKRGETATPPSVPELRGYEFKSWDYQVNNVRQDLTINAIFEPITYLITYINGGSEVNNPTTYTVLDTFLLLEPAKEGFHFSGWYLDGEKITKIEKGTIGNLTLVAFYDDIFYRVSQDQMALYNEYNEILSGKVEKINELPLKGITNQADIVWQSNSTAFSVNSLTGEVSITKGATIQEIILTAILEIDNSVLYCTFTFTIE